MIGKDILSSTFEILFTSGNYRKQVDRLDAEGKVSRKKMMDIIVKVCEALDRVDEDLQIQKDKTILMEQKYDKPTEKPGSNPNNAIKS